jgi:hypothetical protein
VTTQSKPNRTAKAGTDQQVIAGIKQDLQQMTVIPLGASSYSPTSLAAAIQSRIDATSAVGTTRAAWLNAVKTYDAVNAQVTVLVRELRNLVIAAFGADSPKLADFGFKPTVRAPLTPPEKVARAAKALATRKARGTMGKKKKLEITGETAAAAAAASTAPVTTPAAPAPAPAPAAPAPVTPQAPAAPAPVASAPVASPPAPSAPATPAPASAPAPAASAAPAPAAAAPAPHS